MPTGAAVHIVTGIPFSVTFNDSTNTFTITGHDYTSVFTAGSIITALGGTPNGGYQQVTSSVFSGGNTVVTVSSYSVGTSYPGPATFSAGSGTVIWFIAGSGPPPPVGLNWMSRTSPTVNSITGLATTGGTTLAVDSDAGGVYKSTDGGHTWTSVGTVPNVLSNGILAQAAGTWIWSANAANIDRSTDTGVTWTSIATGVVSSPASTVATNGSGTWVVSNNIVGSSPPMAYSTNDGVSWTTYDPFSGGCLISTPFVWDGSNFVAIATTGGSVNVVATSPNGITWTTTPTISPDNLVAIGYFNSNYLATDSTNNATVFSSTTTGIATGTEVPSLLSLVTAETGGNSLYFTFGQASDVANSSDGSTWAVGTLNFDQAAIQGQGPELQAMTAGVSSNLITVGQSGVTFTSTDGVSWTYHSSGQTNALYGVTSGFSVDVAVGTGGTLLTSSNDVTWTANNQGSNNLYGVAFMQLSTSPVTEVIIAVGASGTILATSTPTSTWTTNTSGTSNDLRGVCYQPVTTSTSYVYVVGAGGTILQAGPTDASSTTFTWTPMTSNTSNDLYSVASNHTNSPNPIIVAVGNNNIVCTSINNSTWSTQTLPYGTVLEFVTYDVTNGLFVTGGTFNGVFTSHDGLTWTYQFNSELNIAVFGGYNQSPIAIGTNSCLLCGISVNNSSPTNIMTTTDDVNYTAETAGGGFTNGETITQSNSGATATLISVQAANNTFLVIDTTSITGGTPDGSNNWVGNTSGGVMSPSSTPTYDSAYVAVYDATNNSFIAVGGIAGSISTYP
jgi:hypothetical protein